MTDPTPPTGLIDVTALTIAELLAAPWLEAETVLGEAIRRATERITAPADTPERAVSAFNSAI